MRIVVPLLGVALLCTASCAKNEFVGRSDLAVVQGSGEMPPPELSDLTSQQRPYIIAPFDKISVEVFGITDLARTLQVDAEGNVAYPLAGSLKAAGMTPAQLSALIEQRLLPYVRKPQVTVNADTINQTVTVGGQVIRPGLYPVVGKMTLMRAIASAQGATQYADDSYVVVFRRSRGRDMAALYDIRAINSGLYADPEIYPNDAIYVGDSPRRRLFQDVISSSALLTAPIIALVR